MEKIELKDAFAEFKNQKNIDRPTMMGVLEDVFRTQITKTYGSADNFDIIINIDKGDCEIYWNRDVVEVCLLDVHDTALEVLADVEDTAASEVLELDLLCESLTHLIVIVLEILKSDLSVRILNFLHYLSVPIDLTVTLVDIDDDIEVV